MRMTQQREQGDTIGGVIWGNDSRYETVMQGTGKRKKWKVSQRVPARTSGNC